MNIKRLSLLISGIVFFSQNSFAEKVIIGCPSDGDFEWKYLGSNATNFSWQGTIKPEVQHPWSKIENHYAIANDPNGLRPKILRVGTGVLPRRNISDPFILICFYETNVHGVTFHQSAKLSLPGFKECIPRTEGTGFDCTKE